MDGSRMAKVKGDFAWHRPHLSLERQESGRVVVGVRKSNPLKRASGIFQKVALWTQYDLLQFPTRRIQPYGVFRGTSPPPSPARPGAATTDGFSRSELLTESTKPDSLRH
jgi:hypothetical protein